MSLWTFLKDYEKEFKFAANCAKGLEGLCLLSAMVDQAPRSLTGRPILGYAESVPYKIYKVFGLIGGSIKTALLFNKNIDPENKIPELKYYVAAEGLSTVGIILAFCPGVVKIAGWLINTGMGGYYTYDLFTNKQHDKSMKMYRVCQILDNFGQLADIAVIRDTLIGSQVGFYVVWTTRGGSKLMQAMFTTNQYLRSPNELSPFQSA